MSRTPARRALSDGSEVTQTVLPNCCLAAKIQSCTEGIRVPVTLAWEATTHREYSSLVPRKRLPDCASLDLSPSVEPCGCGLGPSPVRLGYGEHSPSAGEPVPEQRAPGKCSVPRHGSPVPSTLERREGLQACYWEGPSELPERRSSSSAPRRDSAEPRPRGCSGLGEPRQALPSF